MKLRDFGPAGLQVPVVGQGTWLMERDRDASVAALRLGMDLGMTHIDTAEMYGSGRVEEIVGEAIKERRDEVFLASKVMPGNASGNGTREACRDSLRRLDTDWLDLYLLHWPSRHPLEDTLGAFADLQAQGLIRFYGVSNFDVEQLEEAIRLAGPGQIVCDQVLFYLKQRGIEHALVPSCRQNDVAMVGYSPFGQGDFDPRHPTLARLAEARGITAGQVALAFLLRLPGTFSIPKASDSRHVEENAAAADLQLSAEEIAALERAFPVGPRPKTLPTL